MKQNIKNILPAILGLSMLVFTGCSSKTETPEPVKEVEVNEEAIGEVESLESEPRGISEGRTSEGMLPVYFDFDASKIKSDQVPRLEVNADFCKENPDLTIRIEGNCDPRGTNEYNMALGERRALSAKKYLVNLGVNEMRLETISYGEEKMLVLGHDELSWAQDRRDDFVVVE
ncbi:MAG: peptidoglycan-associated lipoprotein [Deltaproteobacteria bacterium]|nr:MAG: peptidoglycan-associated lipoprotein [Deltaproteobacteria bacterium]